MRHIRHLKNTSILSTYLVFFLSFAFIIKAAEHCEIGNN